MLATLKHRVSRMAASVQALLPGRRTSPVLAKLGADPTATMTLAGLTPDRWQVGLLRSSSSRILLLATRQGGKSETTAGLALREALLRARSLVLLLSPSERQSGELFRKVLAL